MPPQIGVRWQVIVSMITTQISSTVWLCRFLSLSLTHTLCAFWENSQQNYFSGQRWEWKPASSQCRLLMNNRSEKHGMPYPWHRSKNSWMLCCNHPHMVSCTVEDNIKHVYRFISSLCFSGPLSDTYIFTIGVEITACVIMFDFQMNIRNLLTGRCSVTIAASPKTTKNELIEWHIHTVVMAPRRT